MFPTPNGGSGGNGNGGGGGAPISRPPSPPCLPSTSSITKFEIGPIMVKQLVVGKLHQIQQGAMMTASVTLIHDHGYYMVVDTPSATDLPAKEQMLRGFNAANLFPGQVQMVLTTHGHPDHTGQANFFPNSRHFFASYEYTGNNYLKTELYTQEEMKVTQNIELWNTPGHTNQDVSAIVRNTPCGIIAVVGDLFYSEADAAGNETTWRSDAWNPEIGDKYRAKVICTANCIVPGHGPVFSVTEEMRNRYNCSTSPTQPPTSPPPGTFPPTIPTFPQPFTSITLPPTTMIPITTPIPMTTQPPTFPTEPATFAPMTPPVIMTLPPAPATPPPPMIQQTQGYITVDYPTPPPYIDINGNQINDSPQMDTISPTTTSPTTTPIPYVTVDHWQYRPQSEDNSVGIQQQPQQQQLQPQQPQQQQPQLQQQYIQQDPQQQFLQQQQHSQQPQQQQYVPAPAPTPAIGAGIGYMPPCSMPCSVPNGLYSVPAGVLPPYPQQLYQHAPAPVPVHTNFIQNLPTFPLKNPFSQPGGNLNVNFAGVILPMVESAATNLVSYLNAPQMQPPAPQQPSQAGYFELIKRAFHKLTDHKPIGAMVVNKGS
uniref:Metallo-beta-lactamase domain-containing protein n=1 Tax=Panagrolaimus sp. ES5 TaxID=591445 RepID=A0AC34FRH8_9BILA